MMMMSAMKGGDVMVGIKMRRWWMGMTIVDQCGDCVVSVEREEGRAGMEEFDHSFLVQLCIMRGGEFCVTFESLYKWKECIVHITMYSS